jgi:hypothetical protein
MSAYEMSYFSPAIRQGCDITLVGARGCSSVGGARSFLSEDLAEEVQSIPCMRMLTS